MAFRPLVRTVVALGEMVAFLIAVCFLAVVFVFSGLAGVSAFVSLGFFCISRYFNIELLPAFLFLELVFVDFVGLGGLGLSLLVLSFSFFTGRCGD